MAKLKDGFYKQTAEAIGSDLYVLLAGGGMKPLADFANASSVDYAAKAGDSDKLGGLPASSYLKVQSLSGSTSKLLSDKVWSAGTTNKGDDSTQNECPTYYGMYLSLQYDTAKNQGYQFYGNTASSTPTLYVRNRQAGDSHTSYNAWKQIAFVSDIPTSLPANGGTADKANALTTPRKIWGQSFDGTGDISGDFYMTGSTMSLAGDLTGTNTNASSPKFWLGAFHPQDNFFTGSYIQAIGDSGYGNHSISFFTKHSSDYTTSPTERMRINSNGNVGIGTTSPAFKLHVSGQAKVGELVLYDNNSSNTTPQGYWSIYGWDKRLSFTRRNSNNVYQSEPLCILYDTENVGINTTTPSKKLTVNGSALLKETTIDAGYVTAHTPSTAGWYTVARVSNYFNFDIYISGAWNHGMPSTIRANICNINGTAYIMQLAGYAGGHCSSIRLCKVSTVAYDVQVYIFAKSGPIGTQVCSFVGYGGIETYSASTVSTTSYSETTELAFTTIWGTPITSSNYTSYTVKKDGTGASGTWGINISGNANTATSSTSSSYSRNLLGRNTSGGNYDAVDGNLIFAEWNTYSDNRWYLKAKGYETRVGYANNSDKLDGIDSTGFLRKITVANNTENDFNIFENITLTGRGDPTTGASLKNAPWSGQGPAGGYGVLTYLWSGYGTQMAWGYNSNRIYIRHKYYTANNGGWASTWDSVALTSDIPTVTNYYWADQPITSSAKSNTTPTFGSTTINGTVRIVPNLGNYQEGIRIQPKDSWSILMLLGTDTTAAASGTSTKSWGLFNNDGSFYLNRSSSSSHTGYELCNIDGKWGIGTTSPIHKLHVDGAGVFKNTGSTTYTTDGVTIGAGDYEGRYITCYGKTSTSYINFGYSASTNNCGELYFSYSSSGSTSNYAALSLYSAANTIYVYPDYTKSAKYINAPGFVHPSYWSSAYALTSDGGVAHIGSMSVNYANSAGSASYAHYLPTKYDGGQQTNPQTYFNNGIGLRVAMTGMSSKGTSYWSDTLWINGYSGGDVQQMCALHFNRDGTPRMFISAQSNQASSYGTFYEVITGYNISSQSVNYASSANYANSCGNADTVDGYHASDFMKITSIGSTGDYCYDVILLCKRDEVHQVRLDGTLFTTGGGVTRYHCADVHFWHSCWQVGAYDVYNSITNKAHNDYNFEICTCTYSGAVWYAIRLCRTQAVSYFFMGSASGVNFSLITYYKTNSGVVNSEINNSISLITSNNLRYNGNIYAAHFYENSDINLKGNIKAILDSDNIPVIKEFDWKSDGIHSYGLIAQELEEQGYSELVSDNGSHKTVNYSAALSLIVGKLQVKIKELEKEIENLKKSKK